MSAQLVSLTRTLLDQVLCLLQPRPDADAERGDVPGWVLVTIMTAGIVAVLWQFAEPFLRDVLVQSLNAAVGR
jgi:hypothetical protein